MSENVVFSCIMRSVVLNDNNRRSTLIKTPFTIITPSNWPVEFQLRHFYMSRALHRAINFQIEEIFNNHYDSLIKSITIGSFFCLMSVSASVRTNAIQPIQLIWCEMTDCYRVICNSWRCFLVFSPYFHLPHSTFAHRNTKWILISKQFIRNWLNK